MKTHGRLDRSILCGSVPAYHDLTPKNKSYEEVPQPSEKEVKKMSRYLLAVVQTLRGGAVGMICRYLLAVVVQTLLGGAVGNIRRYLLAVVLQALLGGVVGMYPRLTRVLYVFPLQVPRR